MITEMNIYQKYQAFSKPQKAVIWFTICNIMIKGISLIAAPIFTRLLSPTEYGKLSVLLSFEQVFIILATWEMYIGPYQRGLFKYIDIKFFTSSIILVSNAFTIIFFLILFLINKWITQFTGFSNNMLFHLAVYTLLLPGYQCWMTKKRTDYEYRVVVPITLAYSVVSIIVPIVALILGERTAKNKYLYTIITGVIFYSFFYFSNIDFGSNFRKKKESISQMRYMLLFQGPLVIHALSYLVLNQADRVMISKMVGESKAAYYSVAYSIASVIGIIQTSINQVFTPWRYHKLKIGDYVSIKKTTNVLLVIIGGVISAFILIAPEIIRIFFIEEYYEAIWSIPPISAGVYFMFLYSIFVNIESYFEKTKYITIVSLICGIVNIILNWILIPVFGYIIAGYTTLLSYILFSVGHYFFMNKILKKELPNTKLFSIKMVIAISVIMLLLTVLWTWLYNYIIIRYVILVIIGLTFFLCSKRVAPFIERIVKKND